jgi:hypothetical protein
MENREIFTIKAVLAFPYLFQEDQNDKYSVQLANLSIPAAAKLEEQGVEIKFKDDDKYGRGQFINTSSKFPYKVVDAEKNDLSGMDIGYGSVVRAKLTTYEWKFKQKKGIGVRVIQIVVAELVEAVSEADTGGMEDAL